jgi:hypothetical protein
LCPIDDGVYKEKFALKYENKKAAEILLETQFIHADYHFQAKLLQEPNNQGGAKNDGNHAKEDSPLNAKENDDVKGH